MTTCPSCGIAGNNFNCQNHTYWGINPNLDLVPPPQTSVNWINPTSAQLFAEIGRLNVLLNERDKEIAALKQTSADLCSECGWRFLVPGIGCQGCERASLEQEIERLKGLMPPDERGPGFVGQGSWSVFAEKVVAERDALRDELAERDKEIEWLRKERTVLVAWLRKMTTKGSPITQVYLDQMLESLANWELSVPWKQYSDQFGRTLPLQGHHKDCGYGKDGWSLCTCDELKEEGEERSNKLFKDLVEEGQQLRKEFDQKTAGMRGPPQCSKCGDTGLVEYGPNLRGMKHCDCKRSGVRQPDPLKELNELKEKDREIERLRDEIEQLQRGAHLLCNLRDNLFEERRELKECLRWYVENDDTNEGGKWEESNGFWLRGKRRAMRALGMEEEE